MKKKNEHKDNKDTKSKRQETKNPEADLTYDEISTIANSK